MELDPAPAVEQPHRPRLQFTIRSMLVLMTVTAVSLAGFFGGPAWVAMVTVYLLITAWPMVLTIVLVYGRDWTRTFCLGALFPSIPLLLLATFWFVLAGVNQNSIDAGNEVRLRLAGTFFVSFAISLVFGAAAMYVRRMVESPRRQERPIASDEDVAGAD